MRGISLSTKDEKSKCQSRKKGGERRSNSEEGVN